MTDKHTMPDVAILLLSGEWLETKSFLNEFYPENKATSYTRTDIHEQTKAELERLRTQDSQRFENFNKLEQRYFSMMLERNNLQAELERVKQSHKELLEVAKLTYYELNAIRARDGAPQHISWHAGRPLQSDSCTHEWWSELTDKTKQSIANAEKVVGNDN